MNLPNGACIRARRRGLGFSQRALAKELGQSVAWVAALERRANHSQVKLAQLARLADILGVSPSELLTRTESEHEEPSPDVVKIEALLFDARRAVPAEVLAKTLDWTLKRTLQALADLDQSLTTRGLSLQKTNNAFRLVGSPNALTKKEWSRVIKAHAARFGLRRNEAETLHGVLRGDIADDWEKRASNNNDLRVCMARLIKTQLVVEDEGEVGLHPDVLFGLDPGRDGESDTAGVGQQG